MNAEHLLDAVGLLDDDLIQEAEEYIQPRARFDYRRWAGLAACAALVLALGYGVTHLNMAGKGTSNGMSAGAGEPSASAPAGGETLPSEDPNESMNDIDIPGLPEPGSAGAPEGDCPAIMVDGALYWSTGRELEAEVDVKDIRTAVSYTSGVPEMDGQTNFSQDLSARYAITDRGLVVEMDGRWILFDTVPPWTT